MRGPGCATKAPSYVSCMRGFDAHSPCACLTHPLSAEYLFYAGLKRAQHLECSWWPDT